MFASESVCQSVSPSFQTGSGVRHVWWVGLEVLKDSHCMHLLVAKTAWHFSVMEEVDLYFLSRSVLFVPLVSNLHSYLICVSL